MVNQDISEPSDFQERFEHYSAVDQERQSTTGQLLEELDRLRIQQQITYNNYVREKESCRFLQLKVENLKAKTERPGFVAVLIDADADDYLFREHFLNKDIEGGKYAANELYADIVGYLQSIKINTENLDIVVRAYASFSSLQASCVKKGLLKPDHHITLFAQGFTQHRGLFDFVDVGPGKERAGFKIKECLDLFVNNYQCKHIIVAACKDAGYAPHLSNLASNSAIRDKFSLVQGGSMHTSVKSFGFPRDPFKLVNIFALPTEIETGMSLSSAAEAQATTFSRHHSENRQDILVNKEAKAFKDKLKPMRDSNGKRIDKALKVDPESKYLKALRRANLCGYYYLRGQCDQTCGKNHVASPLSSHEFHHLWYILRQASQCHKFRNGKDCDDPLCFYGHQAPSH